MVESEKEGACIPDNFIELQCQLGLYVKKIWEMGFYLIKADFILGLWLWLCTSLSFFASIHFIGLMPLLKYILNLTVLPSPLLSNHLYLPNWSKKLTLV